MSSSNAVAPKVPTDLESVALTEAESGYVPTKAQTSPVYIDSLSDTSITGAAAKFSDSELETSYAEYVTGPVESHATRLESLRGVFVTLFAASFGHFMLHSIVFDSLHPDTTIPMHVIVCGLVVTVPAGLLLATCYVKALAEGLWKLRMALSPMFFVAVITGVMFNTLHHFQQYVYTTFLTTVSLYWFSRATEMTVGATAVTAVATLGAFATLVVLIAKHSASEVEVDAFSSAVFVMCLIGAVVDARLYESRRREVFVLQCKQRLRQRDADDARVLTASGFGGGMGPPRGGSPSDRLHAAAPAPEAEMMQSPKPRCSPSGKTLRRRSPSSATKLSKKNAGNDGDVVDTHGLSRPNSVSSIARSILSAEAPPFTMAAVFTDDTVAEASFSDFPRAIAQGPPNSVPVATNPNGGSPSTIVLTKRDTITPMGGSQEVQDVQAVPGVPEVQEVQQVQQSESKAVVPDVMEDKEQPAPQVISSVSAPKTEDAPAPAVVQPAPSLTVDTRPLPHHKPLDLLSAKSSASLSSRPPATPRVTPSSATQSKAQIQKKQRYVNALCARGYPVDLVPASKSVETLKMVLRGFKADVEKMGLEAAQAAAQEKASKRTARAANSKTKKKGIRAPGATPTASVENTKEAEVKAEVKAQVKEAEETPAPLGERAPEDNSPNETTTTTTTTSTNSL